MCKTKTVLTNGIEMKYASFGNGAKPFVIIPGLSLKDVTNAAEAVEKAYRKLEQDYTVYLFDRRTNIEDGYSIRNMADDTAAAMEKLGIQSADVFGASQGGMIAMYLAVYHPALVDQLVLGSTAARVHNDFARLYRLWISLAQEKNVPALAASFADRMYAKKTLDLYRDVIISGSVDCSEAELERFIILAKALDTLSIFNELKRIRNRTLVIGSVGDRVVGVDAQKEIAAQIGCAQYLYDFAYGHAVYDEAPDYVDRLWSFLKGR